MLYIKVKKYIITKLLRRCPFVVYYRFFPHSIMRQSTTVQINEG